VGGELAPDFDSRFFFRGGEIEVAVNIDGLNGEMNNLIIKNVPVVDSVGGRWPEADYWCSERVKLAVRVTRKPKNYEMNC